MALRELRQQVGQLLIMGFDGTEPNARLASLVRDHQPGGVILFARNIVSATQTHALLSMCRKQVTTPLFACVDLEGGTVDRLKNILAPAPSQFDVSHTNQRRLFRQHGELLGIEARALGFNVDFAPVSDLGFERSRNVLGSRTVSSDPKQTTIFVREFLRGLKSARVLGCGKHFPGLGEGDLDSHHSMPVISKGWKALWNEDLVPYRALHRQFPFVMVAHAAYPAVTTDNTPASLSPKWLHEVLRKKIGYRGIILSDDLEMGGVLAAGSIEHAAVETIRAGADMFLVCHKEELVRRTFEAVLRTAERDRRFAKRVAESCARVLRFKKRAPELKRVAPAPTEAIVSRLRAQIATFRRAIDEASA
jgi:beta-N-acetylhexosaminidase